MEIITGYTGKPHVTAEQDRDVNEGIFDTGSFVLKTGSQLAAELVSNNESDHYWNCGGICLVCT